MTPPYPSAPLLVDDYFMLLLERIREARLEFSLYFYDATGQDLPAPETVESFYPNISLVEGQDMNVMVQRLSGSVIALERELLHHFHLLLSMPDVIPLRQGTVHLSLSVEQIAQILDREASSQHFDDDELWEEDPANDAAAFGYPPALIIEALYWPLRAGR